MYSDGMEEAIATLLRRREAAEKKIKRLKEQLSSAEGDLRDVSTAIRVLAQMGLFADEGEVEKPAAPTQSLPDLILHVVGDFPEGVAPKDVLIELKSRFSDEFAPDHVRTTLWRLANENRLRKLGEGVYAPLTKELGSEVTSEPDNGDVAEWPIAPDSNSGGGWPRNPSSPAGSNPAVSAPVRPSEGGYNPPTSNPSTNIPPWRR